MVFLLPFHQRLYPPFHDWVSSAASRIPERERVWTNFVAFSGLSEDRARAILTPEVDPLIDVQNLPGNFGLFVPRQNLDKKISISRNLIRAFKASPQDQTVAQKVEATVLHELIHYAWHHDPARTEPRGVDKGDEFEKAAYDKQVSEEPPRTFASDFGDGELGELSRQYESNGNPGAIAFDSTGGWSYGLYQFASRKGTISEFLDFLTTASIGHSDFPAFRGRLIDAGGDPAARSGAIAFKNAWISLAADSVVGFAGAQHDFVKTSYYEVFTSKLMTEGINILQRSKALKDVAWSVAVQHGARNTTVLRKAWNTLAPTERADDAHFINAIYDERSRVDEYFASSSPNVRRSVLSRFIDERRRALEMLQTTHA